MKLRPFITAALIAITAVPLVSSAQQAAAAATVADLNALPPTLRAALLSGNAAAIEAAINTLSAGNPAQAGTLAGLVARAASFVAQNNPAAAAAGAQAAVAVANTPAVLAANPTASALTAQQATRIASLRAVIAIAPQQAASIALLANLIVSAPAVQRDAPTIAAAVQNSILRLSDNPSIKRASPQLVQVADAIVIQSTTGIITVQPNELPPLPSFEAPPFSRDPTITVPPPSCGISCAS